METSFIELKAFIDNHEIPTIKKRSLTFFDLSKQAHYENAWSNIYAFYFDVHQEHQFKDLFIKSLNELLKKKKIDLQLQLPFHVETERSTIKKNRIDILLTNNNKAIIIENKVFHTLNNDLEDYWNSIEVKNKIGVVLSLKKISKSDINNENYINLTHLDFMNKVISNLPAYFSESNMKYVLFLKEFYQNIINITNPMEQNILNFYYQNNQKINDIVKVKNQVTKFVINEVEKARKGIDEEFDTYANRNELYRYYLYPQNPNLMITVFFGNLMNGKNEILLIVELQNDLLKQHKKIAKIEFTDLEKKLIKNDLLKDNNSWAHFAIESIQVSENDLYNLSEFLIKKINNSPILGIYRKIKKEIAHLGLIKEI